MLEAYVNTHSVRKDGTKEAFCTVSVPVKIAELPWQKAGLTWTATGYGRRIPSRYMVRWGSKWRRVYVCQISNAGTAYIGKLSDNLFVNISHR